MDDGVKKDFDLEIVLNELTKCKRFDDAIGLKEYLGAFSELCRFFKLAGPVFGFVAKDLQDKINILTDYTTSETGGIHYETIQKMVEYEVQENITKGTGGMFGRHSGSRTLLRLHRALEFILEFMRRIMEAEDSASTYSIASPVYAETLAHHHIWLVRKMAEWAMYTLPTRARLIELMCKHGTDEVQALTRSVVTVGKEVYDITQSLYSEYELLNLP